MIQARRASLLLMIVIVAAISMAGGSASAQSNPYHLDENWPHLPAGRALGMITAVAVDHDGNVWAFERCGESSAYSNFSGTCIGSKQAPILEFDRSGKLVKSFGMGMFVLPHGLYVDKGGNVWATDVDGKDGNGHQVFKFSPQGKVLLTLGKRGVTGDGPDTFNAPTAVVVARNGDIFVSDGHGGKTNHRIVKFSKDGKFIKAWGKQGSAPGEFSTAVHDVAIDSSGRLFVADRGNNRIQIFDQDGKFLEEWKQFGKPNSFFIDAKDNIYVTSLGFDIGSEAGGLKPDPSLKPGIRIGSAKDGSVKAFIPQALGADGQPTIKTMIDGIAADSKGNIYGAEGETHHLRKYVKN